jgi:hypothetical protein
MKTAAPLSKLLALSLALSPLACGEKTPPLVPSWDLDVYPILRGSCSHCHGVAVKPGATPVTRYDICNASASAFNSMGFSVGIGASALIAAVIRESAGPTRMPPPPAGPLSEYDITVLERWAKNPTCTKQIPNRKPIARVVEPLTRAGNKTTVTIEISDPDGDQVLGKAKLGNSDSEGTNFQIPGAGRWTLEFTGGNANDRLAITLFDGYEAGQYP